MSNGNDAASPAGSTSSPGQETEKRFVETDDKAAMTDDLEMDHDEYRRIVRKLDWAIIPYCTLLYLLSFLDRVNIGQAAVAGLKGDLGITKGNKYAIALSGEL